MHTPHSEALQALHACADACDHCATACLQEDDVKAMARCVELDIDCAAMCRLTAGFVARGSAMAAAAAALCAQLCDACGQECGRHGHDHCRACAQACRRCSDACRAIGGAA